MSLCDFAEIFNQFGSFSLPVFMFTSTGEIFFCNDAALARFSKVKKGMQITEILFSPLWLSSLLRLSEGMTTSFWAENEEEEKFSLSLVPFVDQLGERGIICAVAPKNTFVADPLTSALLHDLKSPIAIASAAIELALKEKGLSKEVCRYLEIGLSQMKRAKEVFNGIAREIDPANPESYQMEPLNLTSFLQNLCDEFLAVSKLMIRPFSYYLSEEEVTLSADKSMLYSAVGNLLTNALHHGDGPIRLSSSCHEDQFVISVWSEGEPIDSERIPYLFAPFYTTAKDHNLSGLGLYLVSVITSGHGGKAECIPDSAGNEFRISLPLGKSPKLAAGEAGYLFRLPI